jgi:phosphonate transport system substrate-binding protein
MIGTLSKNADQYKVGGKFDLGTLKQKKFSFVSNSSTSGFRVPSSIISKHFGVDSQDLLEGGKDMVFSEVMFGGSHQGSLFNVLSGKADVGVFCNECINNYVTWDRSNYDDPKAGEVMVIRQNADAPFDKVPGLEITFIATVPVLNAPFVVNTNLLSKEEVAAVLAAFTSEETRNNKIIFAPKDSPTKSGFKEGNRFLPVEDKWYDPIRKLSGML